jgi:hypothetical protein
MKQELLKTLEDLKPYVKTIVAAVVGALQVAALFLVLSKDGLSGADVEALINAVILALGGTGAVYALPNKHKAKSL